MYLDVMRRLLIGSDKYSSKCFIPYSCYIIVVIVNSCLHLIVILVVHFHFVRVVREGLGTVFISAVFMKSSVGFDGEVFL